MSAGPGTVGPTRSRVAGLAQQATQPLLIAVCTFAVTALPAFERAAHGFDVWSDPPRRAAVLAVGLALAVVHRLASRPVSAVAWVAAVGGVAALGWRSVAVTLALSWVLAEACRPLLHEGPTSPGREGGAAARRDAAVGVLLLAVGVAAVARWAGSVAVVAVQVAAVGMAVAAPTLLATCGGWVVQLRRLGPAGSDGAGEDAGSVGASELPSAWGQFPGGGDDQGDRRIGLTAAVTAALVPVVVVGAPAVPLPWEVPAWSADARWLVAAAAIGLCIAQRAAVVPRAAAEGGAVAALAVFGGSQAAVSLGLSVLLLEAAGPVLRRGDGGAHSQAARERIRASSGLAVLAIVSGVAAAVGGPWARFGAQAAALAVVWARPGVLPTVGAAFDRLVDVIRALVLALRWLAAAVLWVPLVLVPWAVDRVAGWDPLGPRSSGTAFVPRDLRVSDDRSMWTPPTTRRVRRGRLVPLLRLVLAFLVVPAAIVLVIATVRPSTFRDPVPAAMAGATWWDVAQRAETVTFERGRMSSFLVLSLADVASPTTNVVDGRRVTWRPPGEPDVRVWMFGGSTAFGLGQRDDHTIASELAREAWKQGVAVEVTNFGVHGDLHWTELQRLRDAIRSDLPRPDLVVFYDGWNDQGSHFDESVQRIPIGVFRGGFDRRFADERVQGSWIDDVLAPFAPGPVELTGTTVPPSSHEERLTASIEQYAASVEDSRDFLAAHDLPGAFFLQPTVASRSVPVDGEAPVTERMRQDTARFVEERPAGTVDLSGVMDEVTQPVFYDVGHSNELGARVVARAMLDELLPQLRSAAAR